MRSCRLTILASALGWLLALSGCNPEHQLLRSRCDPDAGCGPPPPACKASEECGAAAACVDETCTSCTDVLKTCLTCPDGTTQDKVQVGVCTGCECRPACKMHSDCEWGSVCVRGGCATCEHAPPECPTSCNWGWGQAKMQRNGCEVCECVPRNECVNDAECGFERTCYPGVQCPDGCNNDPRCCFGNVCSPRGCKPPFGADCVYVGCAHGVCTGDPTCPVVACACSPGAADEWSCPNTCFSSCSPN